jgi:hypothetical protein
MVLMKDERWALAVGNRTDDTHTCSVAVWMRLVAHVLNGRLCVCHRVHTGDTTVGR